MLARPLFGGVNLSSLQEQSLTANQRLHFRRSPPSQSGSKLLLWWELVGVHGPQHEVECLQEVLGVALEEGLTKVLHPISELLESKVGQGRERHIPPVLYLLLDQHNLTISTGLRT